MVFLYRLPLCNMHTLIHKTEIKILVRHTKDYLDILIVSCVLLVYKKFCKQKRIKGRIEDYLRGIVQRGFEFLKLM